MKSEKKILASLLTLSTVFILFGCGSSVSTMNEKGAEEITDTVESGVSADETIDKVEEIKEEEETNDKPAEATASPEPTATASPTPTVTPEPTSTPSPAPTATPEPHVHQYTETIIKAPTCAESGEKQLVCQGCGDVKVEAIPATGEHNWVENTTVIHHEALGHVESVIVGETAKRTEYECSYCGFRSDTAAGVADHQAVQFEDGIAHAGARTIAYDYPGEPIYENQWVVDQEAHDEVVGTGTYTCSECGATK